jgi:hypothetical protein
MQGAFQEPFSPNSFLQNAYQNRKPVSDLYAAFTLPKDIDSACKKAKDNLPKFSFYYIFVAGLFSILFLLTNRIAFFPIGICIGCFYLSRMNLTVNGFTLTPSILLYCFIGVNILLAFISTSIALSYLLLIAFSAVCVCIIFGHACSIETTKDESGNDI